MLCTPLLAPPNGKSKAAAHTTIESSPISVLLPFSAETITVLFVETNRYHQLFLHNCDDGPFPPAWGESETPTNHLLLLLYVKNLAQFQVFPANPDKFPSGFDFCSIDKFFWHQLRKIFSHVQMFCWNSTNRIFIQGRFFCNHPDTQSAVFRHQSSRHFHILIVC